MDGPRHLDGEPSWDRVGIELRAVATRMLRHDRQRRDLTPDALVSECWLRLRNAPEDLWNDAPRLRAAGTVAMRHAIVDRARAQAASKRRAGRTTRRLEETDAEAPDRATDAAELHEALRDLARSHARQARTLELRYVVGLDVTRTASALGVSPRTVKSDCAFARRWLVDRLRPVAAPSAGS